MSVRIPKGESAPLNVTQEAKHRVFAGLGWEPNENTGLLDQAKALATGRQTHHDLDLSCYIYGANGRYISHVSAEAGRETDQTGKIYHSGDNVEGIGDGDDEQISVELKNLDPAIHALIFKASIKSGHGFNEITDPEIRLVDGYSGHNFLHLPLDTLPDNNKPAFVFSCIYRNGEGGWDLRHIGEFTDAPPDGQWAKLLKTYIPG